MSQLARTIDLRGFNWRAWLERSADMTLHDQMQPPFSSHIEKRIVALKLRHFRS
jgi:hypothetical protein